MENWSAKGIPVWDMAIQESLYDSCILKGYIKVEYVSAHQKNPLPELKTDWNW